MAFVQRLITATFTKAVGGFGGQGAGLPNTATVANLRMSAQVIKAGTQAQVAHVRIYGMALSLMNEISTLCQAVKGVQANSLQLAAGTSDAAGELPVIFVGTISQAWVDFASAPQVALDVTAETFLGQAVISAKPTSYGNGVDIVEAMSFFASAMGLPFENSGGVSGRLPPSYFAGTYAEQARKAASDAGIYVSLDNGKLAIWPGLGARGGAIPIVSKTTGMISSPTYTNSGLIIRTEFNPNLVFGGQIQVQSDVADPANGVWNISAIGHDLETMTPRGAWFSTIEAWNPNFSQPVAVAP